MIKEFIDKDKSLMYYVNSIKGNVTQSIESNKEELVETSEVGEDMLTYATIAVIMVFFAILFVMGSLVIKKYRELLQETIKKQMEKIFFNNIIKSAQIAILTTLVLFASQF